MSGVYAFDGFADGSANELETTASEAVGVAEFMSILRPSLKTVACTALRIRARKLRFNIASSKETMVYASESRFKTSGRQGGENLSLMYSTS